MHDHGKMYTMLRVGKKGELRLYRKDGTSARYGIRVAESSIAFWDHLRKEWFEYESGSEIETSDGQTIKLVVEWA